MSEDEEGCGGVFWLGTEAQSSLRDFRYYVISYPTRFEKGTRTVLGYFQSSLRDSGKVR